MLGCLVWLAVVLRGIPMRAVAKTTAIVNVAFSTVFNNQLR
jgi:hypothetical protein